jgi:mitochondrial fission protein ELM1
MNNSEDIWVLTDFRTGNAVQAIALAQSLGMNYSIKKIEYNLLAKFPNFLLGSHCAHITYESKQQLITDNPPKLIISSGRRTALVAAYLKRKYSIVKLVQIMRPNINVNIFDLLVLPQHDAFNISPNSSCSIIRTIGALNNIPDKIEKYQDYLLHKYPSMKSFIGVLVGGDTKDYKFSVRDANELATSVENAISYNGIPAFISFSRRTPQHVKDVFTKIFAWPNILYDPTTELDATNNPYIGILKLSKFLILTCDSVSMCSEAASTGKPIYIYSPPKFNSKKHKYLIQQLIDLNIAKPLTASTGVIEEYHYNALQEVDKIADYVRSKILDAPIA